MRTDKSQLINKYINLLACHTPTAFHSKCATHFSFNVATEIILHLWKIKDVFSLLRITVIYRVRVHLSKVTSNTKLNVTLRWKWPPRILDLGAIWRWLVSFATLSFYFLGPLYSKLGGHHVWCGRVRKQKNHVSWVKFTCRIEPTRTNVSKNIIQLRSSSSSPSSSPPPPPLPPPPPPIIIIIIMYFLQITTRIRLSCQTSFTCN